MHTLDKLMLFQGSAERRAWEKEVKKKTGAPDLLGTKEVHLQHQLAHLATN